MLSLVCVFVLSPFCLFFIAPATTVFSPLSLHDALPISRLRRAHPARRQLREAPAPGVVPGAGRRDGLPDAVAPAGGAARGDRKSTRLNSSHRCISYAVFCLKKKKNIDKQKRATKNREMI